MAVTTRRPSFVDTVRNWAGLGEPVPVVESTTTSEPVVTKHVWSEPLVTAVVRILDADLVRECRDRRIAKNKRPGTCRDATHIQSDVTKIHAALATPSTGDTRVSEVSRVAHEPVARAMINSGALPAFEQRHCSIFTERSMVNELAAAFKKHGAA